MHMDILWWTMNRSEAIEKEKWAIDALRRVGFDVQSDDMGRDNRNRKGNPTYFA